MLIYLIMIVPPVVIVAALLYFRSRLRKMRRQSCKNACCDAAIGSVREVRQQLTKVIEESRAPQSEAAARNGHIPIRSIVILMLFLGAMLTGYELGVHSERNRTQTVGVSPIAESPPPAPHGLIDSKLAELRADPESHAVVFFKYCSIDPARRADVIAALRASTMSEDAYHATAAQNAITRWSDNRDDSH